MVVNRMVPYSIIKDRFMKAQFCPYFFIIIILYGTVRIMGNFSEKKFWKNITYIHKQDFMR